MPQRHGAASVAVKMMLAFKTIFYWIQAVWLVETGCCSVRKEPSLSLRRELQSKRLSVDSSIWAQLKPFWRQVRHRHRCAVEQGAGRSAHSGVELSTKLCMSAEQVTAER
jgi:hypothetical protein